MSGVTDIANLPAVHQCRWHTALDTYDLSTTGDLAGWGTCFSGPDTQCIVRVGCKFISRYVSLMYENLDMNEILLYSIHVSYMSYDMMTDKHMMCSKIDYDGMPWHLGFPVSRRRCVTSPRPWVGAMWSRPVRCGWPRCGQCWTVG